MKEHVLLLIETWSIIQFFLSNNEEGDQEEILIDATDENSTVHKFPPYSIGEANTLNNRSKITYILMPNGFTWC